MRFKIFSKDVKNLKEINLAMKEFVRVANEETKKNKQLRLVNKVFRKVTGVDLMILYILEQKKDHVLLTVRSTVVEQGRLNMRNKMVNQLKGYLEHKGVEYEKIEGFNK